MEKAKRRCEAAERELARLVEASAGSSEEVEDVLALLMDIKEGHPHALYSAGIDPTQATTVELMMEQVCNIFLLRMSHSLICLYLLLD